jgi:tetratricopeptide (TPR) repeat protein
VITIGGYFLLDNDQPKYNDFSSYPTISLTQRSSGDSLFKKAENAFNSRSFKEAADYFSELLVNDPGNQELLLYRGIAQIETGAYGIAYKDLDKVASGSSVYKNEALWYKALGLLKQKNYDKCKLVLVEIPPTAEEYSKAQDLLKKL